MTKQCTKCRGDKSIDLFIKDKRRTDGFGSWCKPCWSKYHKKYRQSNGKDVIKNNRRTWHTNNIIHIKEYNLLYRYGLTKDSYEAMLQAQSGKCAICRVAHEIVVDHDHNTGEVRGLLCPSCNKLLGCAKDSIATLLSAVKYLSKDADAQRQFKLK